MKIQHICAIVAHCAVHCFKYLANNHINSPYLPVHIRYSLEIIYKSTLMFPFRFYDGVYHPSMAGVAAPAPV